VPNRRLHRPSSKSRHRLNSPTCRPARFHTGSTHCGPFQSPPRLSRAATGSGPTAPTRRKPSTLWPTSSHGRLPNTKPNRRRAPRNGRPARR
jgi:hypothetical protein